MLRYLDSFDHYNSSYDEAKWTDFGASTSPSIVPGAGRCGTQCMRINVFNVVTKGIAFGSATTVIGFACKLNNNSTGTMELFRIGNGTDVHLILRRSIDGALYVTREGVTVAGPSAPDVMRDDTYYYVEFKSTIDNAAGAVVVRINTVEVINQTGIDTQAGASATVTNIQFTGNGNANHDIDDLYALDDTGGVNDDFLGDVRVEYLRPTGAGFSQDWDLVGAANHWTAVDDAAAPDGDTSYITSATLNEIDTQEYANTSLPSGTIFGVQVNILARKTDSGARGVKPVLRHSGTDYLGTEQNPSASDYRYLHEVFDENPGTTAPWTISDVNNLQVGVKLTT